MLAYNDAQLKHLLVKTHNRLAGASHVLLISGDHPDGDALGSLIALYHYMQALGVKVTCFSAAPIPETLAFMPLPPLIFSKDELPEDIDVAISFDHSDIEQTGIVNWLSEKKPHLINIDHHPTNDLWGDTNIVTTKAAAACELIYNLYRVNGIPFSKESASALLTGLMTDTGNFGNPATSATAMSAASVLIKHGGKTQTIIEETYRNKSLPSLKFWGEIIDNVIHRPELNLAVFLIPYDKMQQYNATEEWLDGLSNFLTVLSEAKAILVLREVEPQLIKGSFRTTHDDVDVGKLAQILGGGGHQKAAGFTLAGSLAKNKSCWYIN